MGAGSRRELQGPIIIALGANLGDPAGQVVGAMDAIAARFDERAGRSSLWVTRPVGCPVGSGDFVNAVISLDGSVGERSDAETLLDVLQDMEAAAGRRRDGQRNQPRPLDLDLILFGTVERCSTRLRLPHPRAHRRDFVLRPLAELHPHLVWPGRGVTVAELLAAAGNGDGMRRLSSAPSSSGSGTRPAMFPS